MDNNNHYNSNNNNYNHYNNNYNHYNNKIIKSALNIRFTLSPTRQQYYNKNVLILTGIVLFIRIIIDCISFDTHTYIMKFIHGNRKIIVLFYKEMGMMKFSLCKDINEYANNNNTF